MNESPMLKTINQSKVLFGKFCASEYDSDQSHCSFKASHLRITLKSCHSLLIIAATDFPFGNRSRNMNIRTRAVI